MAQQISAGQFFVNGETVDDDRLNGHVNNATLLVGAINGRDFITSKTLSVNDQFLLYRAADNALRVTNATDILRSNLPIEASTITASGNLSTSGTFTSTGLITASAGINSVGNIVTTGNITTSAGSLNSATLNVTGAATIGGAGTTTTINGTVNFTGITSGLSAIKAIEEYTIQLSTVSTRDSSGFAIGWQTLPMTKPVGEIWILDIQINSNLATSPNFDNINQLQLPDTVYSTCLRLNKGADTVLRQEISMDAAIPYQRNNFQVILGVNETIDNTYLRFTWRSTSLVYAGTDNSSIGGEYVHYDYGISTTVPFMCSPSKLTITKFKI